MKMYSDKYLNKVQTVYAVIGLILAFVVVMMIYRDFSWKGCILVIIAFLAGKVSGVVSAVGKIKKDQNKNK